MSNPDPASDVPAEAQELYEQFLRRRDEGEELPFESFLEEHLDNAAELQLLHKRWEKLGGLIDALGGDDGPTHDPGVTLRIVSGTTEPGDPASSAAMERLIERLGERSEQSRRYASRSEIGSGGMGIVYRAWDGDLRRQLAMKVMRPPEAKKSADPSTTARQLGRFLEEAQITGQLDHPGIVPVHELGVDDKGQLYFTMRLVRGRSLRTVFDLVRDDREGWTVPRALSVLLKVCEALAYAHSKNVLHRDIKPSNVMVGRFGEVYVMDWGLAKVLERDDGAEDESDSTNSDPDATLSEVQTERLDSARTSRSPLMTLDGSVVGTPAYMSPEQARGELDKLGPPTDVYAVGALLYQLLAGTMPYVPEGKRLAAREVLNAVREGPPQPLHQLNRRVDPELAAICDKAMARDPRDRYANMSEMAVELRAFLEGRVVRAHGSGAIVELKKWIVRNRMVAILLLLFGLAIAGWGIDQSFAAKKAGDAARLEAQLRKDAVDGQIELARSNVELEAAQVETDRALEKARQNELAAQRKGYVASLAAAQAALAQGSRDELLRHLDETALELRGWEWEHLAARSDASLGRLTELGAPPVAVVFSPDGSRIAAVSRLGELELIDVASGELEARLSIDDFAPTDLVFTPDGGHVAVAGRDGMVRLFDAVSGAPGGVLTGSGEGDAITRLISSGRDGLLLAGTRGGALIAWRMSTGARLNMPRAHTSAVTDLAVSADGGLLLSGSEDRTVALVDVASGEFLDALYDHEEAISAVAHSPVAARFAVADEAGALRFYSVGGDSALSEFQTAPTVVRRLAYTPDGAQLLAGTDAGNVLLFDAWTGERLDVLMGHSAAVSCLDVSADGMRLVTGAEDNELLSWDIAWGAAVTRLSGHTDHVRSLAVSPEGTLLSASWDGRLRLWDPAAQLSLAAADLPGGGSASVAVSPDGLRVAAGLTDVGQREDFPLLVLPGDLLGEERDEQRLLGHDQPINAVAFDPTSRYLASASDDRSLRLWSTERGGLVRTFVGHGSWVRDVAFHPNRPWVASASFDETVRIWNLEDGDELALLQDHNRGVQAVSFSADGRWLASGGEDRVVHVYDTREGPRLVASLVGHRGPVVDVAFHPDGQRLVSASDDGTLRVWSLPEGESLLNIEAGGSVSALAFAPTGDRLFAAVGTQILSFETGRASSGFAARHGRAQVLERAGELFVNLLDALVDPRLVESALLEQSEQEPGVREEAQRLVRNFSTDPELLAEAARGLLAERAADPGVAFEARRLARAANALAPGRALILHTLGSAESRCGNDSDAVAMLARAQLLNASVREYPEELDQLMLSIVNAQLGRQDLAWAHFDEAQRTLDRSGSPAGTMASRLMNEARGLLGER